MMLKVFWVLPRSQAVRSKVDCPTFDGPEEPLRDKGWVKEILVAVASTLQGLCLSQVI